MLAGYLLMHLFNRFLTTQVCDKQTTADYAIGLVTMLGIGFYSLIDGLMYSITFTVSFFTGAVSAIGMVLLATTHSRRPPSTSRMRPLT